MSKNNKDKTEKYLMSLTKQRLVGMLMHDNTKLELLESNKNKDQRILKLEEELAELKENSIVPKFKVGDKVWFIVDGKIEKGKILENSKHKLCRFVYSITGGGIGYYYENYIFATEEEAKQKLKELEGK